MRMLSYVFLAGILCSIGISSGNAAENKQPELVIYTEDYKPFYFNDDNGQVTGLVTRLVQQLAEDAGLTLEMRLRPFKRGLNAVRNNEDHCFMALWRTPRRKQDFLWVGPLQTDGFAFFALQDSDVSVSSMKDSFRFPTGAVGGWTSTMEVQEAGHPKLVLVDDDALNLKMLKQGRTRLWLGGLLSAPYIAEQDGIAIKNVFTIREVDLSLACNLATDRSLIDRLQSALDHLPPQRQNGLAGNTAPSD